MITEEKIVEAAKACGFNSFNYMGANTELLTRFAQHFYRQGLIAGADRCELIFDEDEGGAYTCSKVLRQMAEGG